MIAVKWSSYKEFGCVNCGCEYCYSDGISGPTTPVICGECKTKFLIVNDDLSISTIGYSKEDYEGFIFGKMKSGKLTLNDSDLTAILSAGLNNSIEEFEKIDKKREKGLGIEYDGYVYLISQEHPRKGIAKHKYVKPDVRPENGIGDYCKPRGIGYDLACFVKSREAGQRITDMINKINEEYEGKAFSCRLDYREYEPNWIQVKINYPNELRASFLSGLISDNGYIITEDIVREAITMKVDFVNYWIHEARGNFYNAVEMNFMHGIVGRPEEFTKKRRDDVYWFSWQNNNYLDQFEVWGIRKQIDLELERGNVENAIALAKHLVSLYGDHFNYELMVQRGKERNYITNLREHLHKELVKAVNVHYQNVGNFSGQISARQTCDYKELSECLKLSSDMKEQFLSDFDDLIPMIFDVIDLDVLKMATVWDFEKDDSEFARERQTLSKYSNPYAMFSLFGLYVQVSRNIEEDQFENAVLAVEHVASQLISPLFREWQKTASNNDMLLLRTQAVYAKIDDMAARYYRGGITTSKETKIKERKKEG